MKTPEDPLFRPVEELYNRGRGLFLQGKYEDAIGWFKRLYERDALFQDTAEIVQDYCTRDRTEWISKYSQRFQTRK